jgi:hypothetical protein
MLSEFLASESPVIPTWLLAARDKMEAAGLLAENDRWSDASEQLYRLCWKINIEALRKNPMYGARFSQNICARGRCWITCLLAI